jgi:aspartyl-tRNA(Asn)/glutamyl-tRNA(Gln) amidotransferase subunit B
LPPLAISLEMVASVRERLPALPVERREHLLSAYGLSTADADLLTTERDTADFFDAVVDGGNPDRAKAAANWILNVLMALQRVRNLPAGELPLAVAQLRDLLDALDEGALTGRAAKELLPRIAEDEMPRAAAARLNLLALNDEGPVIEAVRATLEAFPAAVGDYRSGKKAAIGRLIGETIKRTGGRANPDQVRRILESELNGN